MRASGREVQLQPRECLGEGARFLVQLRAALAASLVPVLSTLGTQSLAGILAQRVHGYLELELLRHEDFLIQERLREEDHIEILAAQGMGTPSHQFRILAAQELTLHTQLALDGLEAAGAAALQGGSAAHFHENIAIGRHHHQLPVKLAKGVVSLQAKLSRPAF
jgi:hypothetical protein